MSEKPYFPGPEPEPTKEGEPYATPIIQEAQEDEGGEDRSSSTHGADVYSQDRQPNVLQTPEEVDPVNHPPHYTYFQGIEVIDVTRWLPFGLGNAFKYVCRAGFKDPSKEAEDLKKALFYIKDSIDVIEKYGEDALSNYWFTVPNGVSAYDNAKDLISQVKNPFRREILLKLLYGSGDDLEKALDILENEILYTENRQSAIDRATVFYEQLNLFDPWDE